MSIQLLCFFSPGNVPVSGKDFQLLLGVPEMFPSQMRCIISTAFSGSTVGSPTSWRYILIRGPNHLNWLLSTWRSSGSTPSSLQMSQLLSLRVSPATLGRKLTLLVSAVSFFWSLPKTHDHRWGLERTSTGKTKVLPSGSAPSSPQLTSMTTMVLVLQS